MTDPSVPQPDDERPADPAHDTVVPAVADDPDPDEPSGEEQPKPEHELQQDDDLQAGQYG